MAVAMTTAVTEMPRPSVWRPGLRPRVPDSGPGRGARGGWRTGGAPSAPPPRGSRPARRGRCRRRRRAGRRAGTAAGADPGRMGRARCRPPGDQQGQRHRQGRWTGRGRGGRPEARHHRRSATGRGRATTRLPSPSRPRAATHAAISGQGRSNRSMRCSAAVSTAGAAAIQPTTPSTIADDRRYRADDDAVGHHDQPQVTLGRADRREQAELALPALCHDDEARGGDQADQRHGQCRHDEHERRDRAFRRRGPRPGTGGPPGRAPPSARRGRRSRTAASASPPPRSRRGEPTRNRRSRSLGFSTRPTTVRRTPPSSTRAPMSTPKQCRATCGERDLAARSG